MTCLIVTCLIAKNPIVTWRIGKIQSVTWPIVTRPIVTCQIETEWIEILLTDLLPSGTIGWIGPNDATLHRAQT